jgi:hypothetical protein
LIPIAFADFVKVDFNEDENYGFDKNFKIRYGTNGRVKV